MLLLLSGSTNPWPLQTGSTRVRGQFSVSSHTHILFRRFPSTRISASLSPVGRHFILSRPHISCRAPHLARSSTLDTSRPLLSTSSAAPPASGAVCQAAITRVPSASTITALWPLSVKPLSSAHCFRWRRMLGPPCLSGAGTVQPVPSNSAGAVVGATCYKNMF